MEQLEKHVVSPAWTLGSAGVSRGSRGWLVRRKQRAPVRFHSAPVGSGQHNKTVATYLGGGVLSNDIIVPIPIQMSTDESNVYLSAATQSFCSTTKVKHMTLPNIVVDHDDYPVRPVRPLSRAVTMCGERYTITPISRISSGELQFGRSSSMMSSSSRALSEQQQRFEDETVALARCRMRKRTTEVMAHRMNRSYFMTGRSLRPVNRYATNAEKLRSLQEQVRQASAGRINPRRNADKVDSLSDANLTRPRSSPVSLHLNLPRVALIHEQDDSKLAPASAENFFMTQENESEINERKNPTPNPEDAIAPFDSVSQSGDVVEATEEPVAEEPEAHDVEEVVEEIVEVKEADEEVAAIINHSEENETETVRPEEDADEETAIENKVTAAEEKAEKEEDVQEDERPPEIITRVSKLSPESIEEISKMFADYASTVLHSTDEDDDGDVDSQEDEDDELSEEELMQMMQSGEIKLSIDRSVFKGRKYRSKLIEENHDQRSEFREVTRHLVTHDQDDNAEILLVEPNLSEEQAAAFTKLFDKLDLTKNGRISLEELRPKLFQRKMKQKELKQFMRVFDLNNDRSIDVREFLAVAGLNDKLLNQKTLSPEEGWNLDLEKLSYYITVYREMFELCDVTRDGRISLEELMIIIAAGLDEKTGTDVEMMEDIMSTIDRDNNGYLEFVEYLTYIPLFLQIHHRLMKKIMLVEDMERSRRLVRLALFSEENINRRRKRRNKQPRADIWKD